MLITDINNILYIERIRPQQEYNSILFESLKVCIVTPTFFANVNCRDFNIHLYTYIYKRVLKSPLFKIHISIATEI